MGEPIYRNLKLIVACDELGGIGYRGKIPWHLPADLQRFKKITWGKNIVMGRKTWDSLPKKLPERTHWVLSRLPSTHLFDANCMQHFDVNCMQHFEQLFPVLQENKEEDFFVIGGAEIYRLYLPYVAEIHISFVTGRFASDRFFPTLDWSLWSQQQELFCNTTPAHRYVWYKRAPTD